MEDEQRLTVYVKRSLHYFEQKAVYLTELSVHIMAVHSFGDFELDVPISFSFYL